MIHPAETATGQEIAELLNEMSHLGKYVVLWTMENLETKAISYKGAAFYDFSESAAEDVRDWFHLRDDGKLAIAATIKRVKHLTLEEYVKWFKGS